MSKIITLYHGSEKIIETPEYGIGKKYNDYGKGFYCTMNIELAKEWACQNNNDGYVNKYELCIDSMNILDLTKKDFSILHWINILSENRNVDSIENKRGLDFLHKNFHIDTSNCDLIIGYRADDSYFAYTRDFINNAISLESLKKAVNLGGLGLQVMLKSKKAFSSIEYKGVENVNKEEYYRKYSERDITARAYYRNVIRNENLNDSFILTEIIKAVENKNNDKKQRMTEILSGMGITIDGSEPAGNSNGSHDEHDIDWH